MSVSNPTSRSTHGYTGVTTRTGGEAKTFSQKRTAASIPRLRPPTLMLDLLFGALMLFAFHMGDPASRNIISTKISLPTDNTQTPGDKHDLLALTPLKENGSPWYYELADGSKFTAGEIARQIETTGKTPVLVVSRDARVQIYIEAEQPLRALGLTVGLAVAAEQGDPE